MNATGECHQWQPGRKTQPAFLSSSSRHTIATITTFDRQDFNGASVSLGFTYDNLNRLATETGDPAGSITFGYDNNGNLSTKAQGSQTTTCNYDARDQLRSVKGPDGSQVAAFDYDFGRRRLPKTTASTSLTYAYDGDQVVDEFSNSGALVNRYDWGADLARSRNRRRRLRLLASERSGAKIE